jgi:hypothetical protein
MSPQLLNYLYFAQPLTYRLVMINNGHTTQQRDLIEVFKVKILHVTLYRLL